MKTTPRYSVVPATREHAIALASGMRDYDVGFARVRANLSPDEAITLALSRSAEAWTWLVDGRVICIGGVAPVTALGAMSSPWFMSTNELPEHGRPFLRASRIMVRDWAERYGHLVNYEAADDVVALRWLQWLGFTIYPAKLRDGILFHRFEMRG